MQFPMIDNKSIPHIAIIGAGELGSRHLQGLARTKLKIKISIVDPSSNSLHLAKKRYLKMPANRNIRSVGFFESIYGIDSDIDIVIIATNADVRRKVIDNLLNHVHVHNFILEKVVFQSLEDFQIIIKRFNKNGINAWVNCGRRLWPIFHELKVEILGKSNITMIVSGNNWGLACNMIHMLDIFSFLTGEKEISICECDLNKKIYQSIKDGFIELGGKIVVENKRGNKLILSDGKKGTASIKMRIETDSEKIELDQINEKVIRFNKSTNEISVETINVPLQSELTHIVVQDILNTGNSGLTELEESFFLHRLMIKTFNQHLSSIKGKSYRACPIT